MARTSTTPGGDTAGFAPLTEDEIGEQTDTNSFSRGRSYFRNGHIVNPVRRGDTIEAECLGSEIDPYQVKAKLRSAGKKGSNPQSSSCTCPRGGFCKHIVALLLAWIDDPEQFVARQPLTEVLAGRSREELILLVQQMVQRHPDLESLAELPMPVAGSGDANTPAVRADVIRRQVKRAFASSDAYAWGGAGKIARELQPVLELGTGYADAGRWADAATVYITLATAIMEWLLDVSDDEGDIGILVAECDQGLATCLDTQADLAPGDRLAPDARHRIIETIFAIWHFDIYEAGGIELSTTGPEAIARNVTDDERQMVEEWLARDSADGWGKSMVVEFQIMLREQSGLDDEALLAIYREAELWDDVTELLMRLDRVDEAVVISNRHLTQPRSLINFANALIARGGEGIDRALALVDDRLWEIEGTDPHQEAMLQDWLIQQSSAHGRPQQALTLAQRRFSRQQTLQTFQLVEQAATLPGQDEGIWADLRPKLIDALKEKDAWDVLTELALQAGDVRTALDMFARNRTRPVRGYGGWGGIHDRELRLADAAQRDFPDEAVAIYRTLAEVMIEGRQRTTYKVAAEYLSRAKATLARHHREPDWIRLIDEIRTNHKTLRALHDEMDALNLR
jgi:hypothetical protein